jgi:AbrB family looped-hinge helix DNA binding protein
MIGTLSSKNQTTFPKEVREHLHLKPGDKFKFFPLSSGEVVILPVRPVTALKGSLPKGDKPLTLEEMDAAIEEGATRRYRRFLEDSKTK